MCLVIHALLIHIILYDHFYVWHKRRGSHFSSNSISSFWQFYWILVLSIIFNYVQEKERRERENERERERNYICFCNHAFIYPEDIRCPVMMRTMIMSITIGARAFPQILGIHAFQIWVYCTDLKVNVYMNIIQQHFP